MKELKLSPGGDGRGSPIFFNPLFIMLKESGSRALSNTSGYLRPSATVKSPGFFKLGSCFSIFFKELLTFLLFLIFMCFLFVLF